MEAHFVALEAFEGSKKHIRGSKSILLKILREREDVLLALSSHRTPQKPIWVPGSFPEEAPMGPPIEPKQFNDVV